MKRNSKRKPSLSIDLNMVNDSAKCNNALKSVMKGYLFLTTVNQYRYTNGQMKYLNITYYHTNLQLLQVFIRYIQISYKRKQFSQILLTITVQVGRVLIDDQLCYRQICLKNLNFDCSPLVNLDFMSRLLPLWAKNVCIGDFEHVFINKVPWLS